MVFDTNIPSDNEQVWSYCGPVGAPSRNLLPSLFLETDMTGVIVGKSELRGQRTLYPIADDLEEINIYCRRYYRGENPNAASETIDDPELQAM